MKDLRTRKGSDIEIDLDGPGGWDRGDSWDPERPLHASLLRTDDLGSGARPR